MAEFWLEEELRQGLRRVAAPMAFPVAFPVAGAVPRPRQSFLLPAMALAAVALAGVFWGTRGDSDLDAMARRELKSMVAGDMRVDFASDDPKAVRDWVRAGTGAEVEIRRGGTQLIGARLARTDGGPVGVVVYRTGKGRAALFVEKRAGSGLGVAGHVISTRSVAENRSFSWRSRDQEYALAVAGTSDPHAACALCHEAGVL